MLGLLSVGLTSAILVQTSLRNLAISLSLQDGPILLDVPVLTQKLGTSCGEAAIVMAYNYVHPDLPLDESDVVEYAIEKQYFTPDEEPFTSPQAMVRITQNYTRQYASGNIFSADQGLELIISELKMNTPIIIDVLTHLDDPQSDAHFVVVTGVSAGPNGADGYTIYYNDLLTGKRESASWGGDAGIWNAWQNNPDPNGSGWWLVIMA